VQPSRHGASKDEGSSFDADHLGDPVHFERTSERFDDIPEEIGIREPSPDVRMPVDPAERGDEVVLQAHARHPLKARTPLVRTRRRVGIILGSMRFRG
jgi:hypothetical protein